MKGFIKDSSCTIKTAGRHRKRAEGIHRHWTEGIHSILVIIQQMEWIMWWIILRKGTLMQRSYLHLKSSEDSLILVILYQKDLFLKKHLLEDLRRQQTPIVVNLPSITQFLINLLPVHWNDSNVQNRIQEVIASKNCRNV